MTLESRLVRLEEAIGPPPAAVASVVLDEAGHVLEVRSWGGRLLPPEAYDQARRDGLAVKVYVAGGGWDPRTA